MKVTRRPIQTEREEIVCEITKAELETVCAKSAAHIITKAVGDELDMDDLLTSIILTDMFAKFTAHLVAEVFEQDTDKSNQSNKKEKQEEN